MAKLNDEQIQAAFQPYLQEGEGLQNWAVGVKQLDFLVFFILFLLAILPGIIANILLTKNFLIGLTNRRFLVLQINSLSNATVKQITEYTLDEVRALKVDTSTGRVFTRIRIDDATRPFVVNCNRAFSKNNRAQAMAISEAIVPPHRG